jgi:hypothetical protein
LRIFGNGFAFESDIIHVVGAFEAVTFGQRFTVLIKKLLFAGFAMTNGCPHTDHVYPESIEIIRRNEFTHYRRKVVGIFGIIEAWISEAFTMAHYSAVSLHNVPIGMLIADEASPRIKISHDTEAKLAAFLYRLAEKVSVGFLVLHSDLRWIEAKTETVAGVDISAGSTRFFYVLCIFYGIEFFEIPFSVRNVHINEVSYLISFVPGLNVGFPFTKIYNILQVNYITLSLLLTRYKKIQKW